MARAWPGRECAAARCRVRSWALLLGLAVGGWGAAPKPAEAGPPTVSAPAPGGLATAARPAPLAADTRRWDACVQAHNALAGLSYGPAKGLPALLAQHRAQRLDLRHGAPDPAPVVVLNVAALRVHLHALQRALAAEPLPQEPPGLLRRMHASGAEFLRWMERWTDYLSSGQYRQDGYALGRQMEPHLVAGWSQLIDHHVELGDWLQTAERERRRATVAEARVVGDLVLADLLEALGHASDVLDVLDDVSALAGPTAANALRDGDRHAQRLEQALARLQQPKGPRAAGRDAAQVGPVAQALAQLLQAYRTARRAGQAPSEQVLDAMESHYNTAVRLADRLP